jgi:hypothetical protein
MNATTKLSGVSSPLSLKFGRLSVHDMTGPSVDALVTRVNLARSRAPIFSVRTMVSLNAR